MSGKLAVFASACDIHPDGMVSAQPATVCLTSSAHASLIFSRFKFQPGFQLDHLTADDLAMRFRLTAGRRIDQLVIHVTQENLVAVRQYMQSSAGAMLGITIILDMRILAAVPEFPPKTRIFLVTRTRAPIALGKMSKRWNERGEIIPPSEMSVCVPKGDGPSSTLHLQSRR